MKITIEHDPDWKPSADDLAPIPVLVTNAVAALAYVRPEAAAWFAEKLAEHFFEGHIDYKIRKSGDLIPKDHLADLGYPKNLHLSYEAHAALTDKGRGDPEHAYEVTVQHVISAYYRATHRTRRLRNTKVFPWVRLLTVPKKCCAAAEALTGIAVPAADEPDLPLAGCDREICSCSLSSLMDSDIPRLKLKTR